MDMPERDNEGFLREVTLAGVAVGWSIVWYTKRSWVQFPVRTHA